MAYRTVYGPVKVKQKKPRQSHRKLLIAAVILALIIGLRVSGFGEKAAYWLLPGDKEVTAAALQNMADHIKAGEHISDAFTCFCQEIIENADLAE